MKQILFLLLLACNTVFAQDEVLDEVLETPEDYEHAAASFHAGQAKTGEEFFTGLLAEIIMVDIEYREMEEADNTDATEAEINKSIDEALEAIAHLRQSLAQYIPERWPRQQEFSDLSLEWIKSMEGMLNDFARPLAAAMAKPDEDWTEEEYLLYDDWTMAYDVFLEIDMRWVSFQEVFAVANGFTLSDEIIDVDQLMEEGE